MNFMTPKDDSHPLNLSTIRRTLIRLEDTIIMLLIERAQFAYNPKMYDDNDPGFSSVLHTDSFKGSWLDWLLRETESIHAKVRRFESPDEFPFTPRDQLPPPILAPLNYPTFLYELATPHVNANKDIKAFYIEHIVPEITRSVTSALGKANDDGNYGSSATRDIDALQAISRRIHCGLFVSESKFRAEPWDFIAPILEKDVEKLESLITKPAVEAALLVRLERKAKWYGTDPDTQQVDKVQPEVIVKLYRDYVIPLTRKVEVDYLLHRLDGLDQAEIDRLSVKGATV